MRKSCDKVGLLRGQTMLASQQGVDTDRSMTVGLQ